MTQLRQKLRSLKRVYGTAIVSASPHWPQAIKPLDLDFVFIDWEHMAYSRSEIMHMCQWYRGIGVEPLVRVLTADPNLATAALDAGAAGILAPYIESAEQVIKMVGAVHYRPLKGEKLKAVLGGKEVLTPMLKDYIEARNKGQFLWINIESRQGVNNLPEILKVKGLDGVLIGPHDLSCSYDIPEQYDHPEFIQVVDYILESCLKEKISVGIHFSGSTERQKYWLKKGANIVSHSSDLGIFARGLAADLKDIKKAMDEENSIGDVDVLI